ncbi:MAG TPA: FHA domain-containing protein, partial [Pirellulaceae bacterium]|nr:FHA domain-containing protein [Pirellulaceae bacterium]
MRVILELVSGPQAGRRIHLLRNQSVQVGNTSWSDFVVRDDQQMVGQHFALETDYGSCRLRDLAGGGATQLNGQPVTELTLLRSGDQIVAGSSTFSIQIEGGDTPAAPLEQPMPARA